MKRHIIITDNSVWLVEDVEPEGMRIADRATFGSPFITAGRRFAGKVLEGELRAGSRLAFENSYPNVYGERGRLVQTGVINRVVAFVDEPLPEVPEGFIDITPSWEAIAPVRPELARQAGKQADRLVSLKSLGRIDDDDIRVADARTDERMS